MWSAKASLTWFPPTPLRCSTHHALRKRAGHKVSDRHHAREASAGLKAICPNLSLAASKSSGHQLLRNKGVICRHLSFGPCCTILPSTCSRSLNPHSRPGKVRVHTPHVRTPTVSLGTSICRSFGSPRPGPASIHPGNQATSQSPVKRLMVTLTAGSFVTCERNLDTSCKLNTKILANKNRDSVMLLT